MTTATPMGLIKKIPSAGEALKALLRADAIVQWRQRRAMMIGLLLPIIYLISWRSLISVFGGLTVLTISISVGLPATGLMGYSLTLAKDRDRGVFQRLRTAPIPTWVIMVSRILVQLGVIVFMTIITIVVAAAVDKVHVSFIGDILCLVAALIGGAAYLALGQAIVGLVKSSDAVNAVARLVYIFLAAFGALAEFGVLGAAIKNIVQWSPLGTTQVMLAAAVNPHGWTIHLLWAALATLGYIAIFTAVGIKYFRWSSS